MDELGVGFENKAWEWRNAPYFENAPLYSSHTDVPKPTTRVYIT